jgi:hypothetical protein
MTSFRPSVVSLSAYASPPRGDLFFVPALDAILRGSHPVMICFSINETPTDYPAMQEIRISAPSLAVSVANEGMNFLADGL